MNVEEMRSMGKYNQIKEGLGVRCGLDHLLFNRGRLVARFPSVSLSPPLTSSQRWM